MRALQALTIYFGCGLHSQKAGNLALDDRVSLTVTLPYTTRGDIRGISLFGRARALTHATDIADFARLFEAKLPELEQYAQAGLGEMASPVIWRRA